MKLKCHLQILLTFVMLAGCTKSGHQENTASNESAQNRLMSGNKRFITAHFEKSHQTSQRRLEVAKGQHPFAAILCCSDSRVPPEVIFDQGLGDLFVIRIAGNIIDDAALGSLEYAVEHLGVKTIIVLGHERCGAVDATLKGGAEHHNHIDSLVKAIQPAIVNVKSLPGDMLDNAVRENIKYVVQGLSSSEPILKERVAKKELKVLGARYDLDDGVVEFLQK